MLGHKNCKIYMQLARIEIIQLLKLLKGFICSGKNIDITTQYTPPPPPSFHVPLDSLFC